MSYKVKGQAAPVVVAKGTEYDAATGEFSQYVDYEGTVPAIVGMSRNAVGKQTHSAQYHGSTGRITFRTPLKRRDDMDFPTYEIASEVVEKEIWEHPDIIWAADQFDSSLSTGEETFKKLCEKAVDEKWGALSISLDPGVSAIFNHVVQMIKSGITGWEYEYVVVRRKRRTPMSEMQRAPSVMTNLSDLGSMRYVYSTAQLLLPAYIAFSVPDSTALTPRNGYSIWGWRRRPSTVSLDGYWIDQQGEFLLAEWDNLLYTASPVDAAW